MILLKETLSHSFPDLGPVCFIMFCSYAESMLRQDSLEKGNCGLKIRGTNINNLH